MMINRLNRLHPTNCTFHWSPGARGDLVVELPLEVAVLRLQLCDLFGHLLLHSLSSMRHGTRDLRETRVKSQVIRSMRHVTCDMRHVTCDM